MLLPPAPCGEANSESGSQECLLRRPIPSLDGEWECLCDCYKTGKLANLTMEIQGPVGKCYIDGNVTFKLSEVAARREGRWIVTTCRLSCRSNHLVEEGAATWRFRGAGDFVGGVVMAVTCNCLEGSWSQDGHGEGPWKWNCRRRDTLWWYEKATSPGDNAGVEEDPEPAVVVPEWQRARQEVLDLVAHDGHELQHLREEHRGDPDIVLLAVSRCAEALSYACAELLLDRGFLLEAVRRNGAALACVPEALRKDRALVRAALQQDSGALRSVPSDAHEELAAMAEAGEAIGPPAYEGECLRLVGCCNAWSTSDSHLRFSRHTPDVEVLGAGGHGASLALAAILNDDAFVQLQRPVDTKDGPRATRHRLVVRLLNGSLSFQVISCVKGFSFRVFPVRVDHRRMARLKCGDPSAVAASIGGEKSGCDMHFYIEEPPDTVVSIYVELLDGFAAMLGTTVSAEGHGAAGTLRGAAVWYALEHSGLASQNVAALSEPPKRQRPQNGLAHSVDEEETAAQALDKSSQGKEGRNRVRASPWEVMIIADADNPEDLQALCSRVLSLGEGDSWRFQEAVGELMHQVPVLDTGDFTMEAEPHRFGYKRMTLLVDASGTTVLGYCLWVEHSEATKGFMWILHLAVLEAFRGEGLGRVLIRWAVARVASGGGKGVRLKSVDSAVLFYEAVHFQVRTDLAARVRGIPMELRLPRGV